MNTFKQSPTKYEFFGESICFWPEKAGLEKTRVLLKKPNPLGFFGFYLVLLGYFGFYWVLLGFSLFVVFFCLLQLENTSFRVYKGIFSYFLHFLELFMAILKGKVSS